VVKKIRGALKIKKIGHAGTLDPMATGLLLLCTGRATKQISHLQELKKVYRGTIVLGKTTPSMDKETAFDHICDYTHLKEADIQAAAATFVGNILQTPPIIQPLKSKANAPMTWPVQG